MKILSFNCWLIQFPFFGAKNIKYRLAQMPARLAAHDADLLCLQEVWHPKIADELRYFLEAEGYPYIYNDKVSYGSGLMVFSRFPFGEVSMLRHNIRARGLEKFLRKGVCYFDWQHPQGRVRIVNAHLGAEITPEQRQLQIQRIATHAWQEVADPVVIAGDLNFPRQRLGAGMSPEFSLLTEKMGFQDSFRDQAGDTIVTLSADNPYVTESNWAGLAVDYILTRGFSAEKKPTAKVIFNQPIGKLGEKKIFLSDHFGVMAKF